MKKCTECNYFNGYDNEDGTIICDVDGGYENCPYNTNLEVKKCGVNIEIDGDFMIEYIKNTLENTIASEAHSAALTEVKNIIDDEVKDEIKNALKEKIDKVTDEAITEYLNGEITVGGGWLEEERKLTRTQYLSELIEKSLKKQMDTDHLQRVAREIAESKINSFTRQLREDINKDIQNCFDTATRQTLTDNVVSLLMSNDTYKKLSKNMGELLALPQEGEQ
jgi:hypothetical protein